MSKYRWLIQEAKRLGFNLTTDRYGSLNHDFQLLGFRFVTGYYKDRHKAKEKSNDR